jgi:sialate O-acetylesterase
MKRFLIFLMTFIIISVISSKILFGEVKLPAIFGDNMVLQQQTEAAIWGTASKNATVKVSTSWNKKKLFGSCRQ